MTNAEIITGLRHCGKDQECSECPLHGKPSSECVKILLAAADALEAAEKRIAELEAQIQQVKSQIYDLEDTAKRAYDDDSDNEYLEGYFDGLHHAAKLISTTSTTEER